MTFRDNMAASSLPIRFARACVAVNFFFFLGDDTLCLDEWLIAVPVGACAPEPGLSTAFAFGELRVEPAFSPGLAAFVFFIAFPVCGCALEPGSSATPIVFGEEVELCVEPAFSPEAKLLTLLSGVDDADLARRSP